MTEARARTQELYQDVSNLPVVATGQEGEDDAPEVEGIDEEELDETDDADDDVADHAKAVLSVAISSADRGCNHEVSPTISAPFQAAGPVMACLRMRLMRSPARAS